MQKIELDNKVILVTGSAGFIGSNLVKRLFRDVKNATIVGIDNMNDYYDVSLKEFRLNELKGLVPEGIKYEFVKGDIADKATIDGLFAQYKPAVVVNLAAQAGVRYSITNPDASALLNRRQGGQPREPLCSHEEVERAAGPCLFQAL